VLRAVPTAAEQALPRGYVIFGHEKIEIPTDPDGRITVEARDGGSLQHDRPTQFASTVDKALKFEIEEGRTTSFYRPVESYRFDERLRKVAAPGCRRISHHPT
jgi:hypothetical protein